VSKYVKTRLTYNQSAKKSILSYQKDYFKRLKKQLKKKGEQIEKPQKPQVQEYLVVFPLNLVYFGSKSSQTGLYGETVDLALM